VVLTGGVELTVDQQAELRALVNSPDVPAVVDTRARIVLSTTAPSSCVTKLRMVGPMAPAGQSRRTISAAPGQ
jgi:hypothetical protein